MVAPRLAGGGGEPESGRGASRRVRVTRRGLPSLAAAHLTGNRHGPTSLAAFSSLATVRLTRYYSPRPESLAAARVAGTSRLRLAVIQARRGPSHSGATRPGVTCHGPSITSPSLSPRPKSLAAARLGSHLLRPESRSLRRRRPPSLSAAGHWQSPRPAVTRRGPTSLTAVRRPRHGRSPLLAAASLATARLTLRGPGPPSLAVARVTSPRPPEFHKPESLAAAPSESPAAARSHLPRPESELIAAASLTAACSYSQQLASLAAAQRH